MTDLTEQWKKRELKQGWYYINSGDIDYKYSKYNSADFFVTPHEDIKEVLAPVPTYQEYLESEAHCAIYSEENKQLRQLLKECQHMILAYSINHDTFTKEKVIDTVKQIDKAIGEK